MKSYCVCLFISLFCLFSCQHREKTEVEVVHLMHGTWVPKNYVNSIQQTLSPYESRSLLFGVSEIDIDSKQLVAFDDSLSIGMNFNNHEAVNLFLSSQKGTNALSFCFKKGGTQISESLDYQLGLQIAEVDTLLVLCGYDKQGNLIEKTEYVKFSDTVNAIPTNNNGIQRAVNQILFAGNYDLMDKEGKRIASVTLNKEGQIGNFKPFHSYYVVADFAIEYQNNADQFLFNLGENDQQVFIFENTAKGFTLYQIKDREAPELEKGEVVYRFDRK